MEHPACASTLPRALLCPRGLASRPGLRLTGCVLEVRGARAARDLSFARKPVLFDPKAWLLLRMLSRPPGPGQRLSDSEQSSGPATPACHRHPVTTPGLLTWSPRLPPAGPEGPGPRPLPRAFLRVPSAQPHTETPAGEDGGRCSALPPRPGSPVPLVPFLRVSRKPTQ